MLKTFVKHGVHPFLIFSAFGLWFLFDKTEIATLVGLLFAQVLLFLCEKYLPSHPEWTQPTDVKATLMAITIFDLIFFGIVSAIYNETIATFIKHAGANFGLNHSVAFLPIVAQVAILFFLSELVFYWIHRGIHGSKWLWRLSGHGFHHSFHNMHAINFFTAHPFEVFLLVLPITLISLLFGFSSEIIAGASVLSVVNGSFAHSNFQAKSKWLGLILTTNRQHQFHHSMIYEESNTNFSCSAILWDRVFGTFADGDVKQTGIAPIEPTFVEKCLLPFREPISITAGPK